jgi:hypothetical protein
MNNLCPTCQALYNVRPKDVGRRVTCKKCGTALAVADAGLVLDQPAAAPADRPEDVFAGVAEPPRRRGRDRDRPARPAAGVDWRQAFRDLGGVPTALFAGGAFLVIVFLFQPLIGAAAVDRARGAAERLDLDWKAKERKLRKEKKSEDDVNKAREEFYKSQGKDEVDEAAAYEAVAARRSRWLDLYGLMAGFLLLMAGSVGYTADRTSTVRRVLGTVVLGAQMLIVFAMFAAGGGCGGAGPRAGL